MKVTLSVDIDVWETLNSLAEKNSFAESLAQWILDDPHYFTTKTKNTTRKRLIEIFREED